MSDRPKKKPKTSTKLAASNAGSDSWKQHLFPTLMSIISQSLKINEHNYIHESILFLQNLCSKNVWKNKTMASFLKDDLAKWQYKKDKREYLDICFPLVKRDDVSSSIAVMHATLVHLTNSFKECQFNQNSLPFEIKSTRNYVEFSWQRINILALAYSIIYFLFQDPIDKDKSLDDKDHAVLLFTFDVMVEVGGTRATAVNFLKKLTIGFSLDFKSYLDVLSVRFTEIWKDRKDPATIKYFFKVVDDFSDIVLGTEVEPAFMAVPYYQLESYAKEKKNRMVCSKKAFESRKYRSTSYLLINGKVVYEEEDELQTDDIGPRTAWWSFLCSRTFHLFLEPKTKRK